MLRLVDITSTAVKYRLWTVDRTLGHRLRSALEHLGPVFVKFGQLLSTRPDLVPNYIVKELTPLRDNVAPFDSSIVVEIIERELGNNISEIFKEFNYKPIASASMAQVHSAVLHTDEEVVIKILRPGIEKIIKDDLALFKNAAVIATLYKSYVKNLQVGKIIDLLTVSMLAELDLVQEANSLEKFATNMKDCRFVVVPKVYKNLSTTQILTMERVYGTPIDQVSVLQSKGILIENIVKQGLEALMLQVFRDGFFHADQHPGNLWIADDGSRIYLDFGIVGSLSEVDRKTLLKILFFLYSGNFKKVIESIVNVGWVSSGIDIPAFENELSKFSKLFVNRKQQDISIGTSINQLFLLFEKYNINIPYQFTLLCKTILVVEGLSKTLAPKLDIQSIAKPIMIKYFLHQ